MRDPTLHTISAQVMPADMFRLKRFRNLYDQELQTELVPFEQVTAERKIQIERIAASLGSLSLMAYDLLLYAGEYDINIGQTAVIAAHKSGNQALINVCLQGNPQYQELNGLRMAELTYILPDTEQVILSYSSEPVHTDTKFAVSLLASYARPRFSLCQAALMYDSIDTAYTESVIRQLVIENSPPGKGGPSIGA